VLCPGIQPAQYNRALHIDCNHRQPMRRFIPPACLFAIAAVALAVIAQPGDLPTPTPVPFTPEPRQLQWRIGFDLGNATILEAPELNPETDSKLAVGEAARVLGRPLLSFGLALLPFSK